MDLPPIEIDRLIKRRGHQEDWQLIYRLKAMPFAQAFSKLKIILTFSLIVGTPIATVLHLFDLVGANLPWFLLAASSVSLSTLCLFSYYSTQVIGVVGFLED